MEKYWMSYKFRGMDHIGITIPDIEAATRFLVEMSKQATIDTDFDHSRLTGLQKDAFPPDQSRRTTFPRPRGKD